VTGPPDSRDAMPPRHCVAGSTRRPGASPPRSDEPLPAGLRIGLDPGVRRIDGGRVLVGGSPLRLLRITESGSALGGTGGRTVEVLLEQDALADVLGALANDAVVSLVPAPGQGG